MSNELRTLQSYYPFLPCESMEDVVANILDAKIVYTLPAGNYSGSSNIDGIVVTLIGINANYASFRIYVGNYGHTGVVSDIPVYTGRDTYPTTESYVIVEKTATAAVPTRTYRLHPDCLVLRQLPPKLTFQTRTDINAATTESTTGTYTFTSDPKFIDGKNVSVTGSTSSVVWTGNSGLGDGVYTTLPFRETKGKTIEYGKGLRSICGLTGIVTIKRSGSAVTLNTSKADTTITVTLGSDI